MADTSPPPPPGELRRRLQEQAGLDLVTLKPTSTGESGTAFEVTDQAGAPGILKIVPGAGAEAVRHLRALEPTLNRLRERGYPAPRFRTVGSLPGLVFWIQDRLPGAPLDPDDPRQPGNPVALARLMPELIRLNDAQAGLGTGPRTWPALIRETLTSGGHGYCLHATLEADPRTRGLFAVVRQAGAAHGAAVPPGDDFVHYDFTLANMLSDGTAITGVIDINPPVLAGDRAFDLATLLFYVYDHDELRGPLRSRLLELAGPGTACAYLAHMLLRQVDWSLRLHPEAAATERHLRLARLVASDIGHGLARRA